MPQTNNSSNGGRTLDPAELEVVDATRGIYRRVAGDPQWLGQEYIEMDRRYFAILPRDAAMPNKVFIRDPAQPARYFMDLENLVRSGIYNQPRQARFASGDGLWVIASGVALKKPITVYVREALRC